RYTEDYYANKPAITINYIGSGRVVYIGTVGDQQFYDVIGAWLIKQAGMLPLLDAPPGVEVMERWQGSDRLLFVLNHTEQEQAVNLGGSYTNLLNGASERGTVRIPPRDVLVLGEAQP